MVDAVTRRRDSTPSGPGLVHHSDRNCPIHQPRRSETSTRQRHDLFDEPERELLGQCCGRKASGDPEARATGRHGMDLRTDALRPEPHSPAPRSRTPPTRPQSPMPQESRDPGVDRTLGHDNPGKIVTSRRFSVEHCRPRNRSGFSAARDEGPPTSGGPSSSAQGLRLLLHGLYRLAGLVGDLADAL